MDSLSLRPTSKTKNYALRSAGRHHVAVIQKNADLEKDITFSTYFLGKLPHSALSSSRLS
jgi:hypothetical protein